MRRPKSGDNSASTLFPFLAVLLCTMGAMVVLLVAMAHVSRSRAAREAELAEAAAEAAREAADSPERRAAEARLAEAEAYAERLRELRRHGEERLAEEQARLSDIEDHLRRLRDEAEELTVETAELVAVEEEYYDDQKVAEQEFERLNRLIGDIEDEIEELKHAASGRERKYAVVALRNERTGTIRPPVYFECNADGVVLQPEGIAFDWQDLAAPKFSSPLAAAARAVGRYYTDHPEARAANEAGKPYPLIIVRPDGVESYYRARTAMELSGVDYGYQPVSEEWSLEYGDPNALVAQRVGEAVEFARRERVGLSRVIPKLASQLARGAAGPPKRSRAIAVVPGGPGGDQRTGGGLRVKRADPNATNPFEGVRIEGAGLLAAQSASSESGRYGEPTATLAANGAPDSSDTSESPRRGALEEPAPGEAGEIDSSTVAAAIPLSDLSASQPTDGDTEDQESTATAPPNGIAPTAASPRVAAANADQATAAGTAAAIGAPPQAETGRSKTPSSGTGGRNQRSGMAVVRPIKLLVAADRVVVLNREEQGSPSDADGAAESIEIPLTGPTAASVNEVVAALKRHADSWGIAGRGMYWDPRLVLNVEADGQQRARELTTLLKAAGLKVQRQPDATATRSPAEGGDHATRR